MNNSDLIRLAHPNHTQEMERAVLDVLRSGWLMPGVQTELFETALRRRTGRKYAMATSTGTGALVAAMAAMGVGKDSTVVVPAFTFPAPARAAAFLGARVRLCDVDAHTFNLSPDTLQNVMDDRVSLVVAIDQFGAPCPAMEIADVCKMWRVPLLLDAACSLGATRHGRPCGAWGDAAIMSFHPRKLVTTGQGGVVLTDDNHIAAAVRRFRDEGVHGDAFCKVGFNLRPSEMGAAMGAVQMAHLDELLETRRRLAEAYSDLPFIGQQPVSRAEMNYQSFVAVIPELSDDSGLRPGALRTDLIGYLAAHGIEAQLASYHLAQLDWLVKKANIAVADTPVSASLGANAVALPIHCGMTRDDVKKVVETCNNWLVAQERIHGRKIREIFRKNT